MARVRSSLNDRGVDFGDRLGRFFDRDFRKAVKVGMGANHDSEVLATASGSPEAASVHGASTAGVLLGHV